MPLPGHAESEHRSPAIDPHALDSRVYLGRGKGQSDADEDALNYVATHGSRALKEQQVDDENDAHGADERRSIFAAHTMSSFIALGLAGERIASMIMRQPGSSPEPPVDFRSHRSRSGQWICYRCGESRGIIDVVRRVDNLTLAETRSGFDTPSPNRHSEYEAGRGRRTAAGHRGRRRGHVALIDLVGAFVVLAQTFS